MHARVKFNFNSQREQNLDISMHEIHRMNFEKVLKIIRKE